MTGGALLSGPGQACLDALRCTAFLVKQHPEDLKQAFDTVAASSTTTTGVGADSVSWLEPLVETLQGLVGKAGVGGASRRSRKRKKRRRKGQRVEGDEEHAGSEEEEEDEARASEEDEEGGEAGAEASRAEMVSGGPSTRGQQAQQWAAVAAAGRRSEPTGERAGMEVGPAASVSAAVGARADMVSSSDRRGGGGVKRVPHEAVLSSDDLLGSIFSFVVGWGGESTGRQSVRQLGQLGLVCRKWREVSAWEAWWSEAAEEMLPAAVWGRGEGGRAGGRRRVLEHGRMVRAERRVWMGEWGWEDGLSVQFEVFDPMDGLQMLSVRGPLNSECSDDGRAVFLQCERRRWEVQGRPFSAASRDPEQWRFVGIDDFFEEDYARACESSVCVRVSVTDEWTGRRAVLWEDEGSVSISRMVVEMPIEYQDWLGEGSFYVRSDPYLTVMCPQYSGPQIYGQVRFCVAPVEGQAEGVSEQERLYQLAGGDEEYYEQHPSFKRLCLSDGDFSDPNKPPVDLGAIGRYVRSVLRCGTG